MMMMKNDSNKNNNNNNNTNNGNSNTTLTSATNTSTSTTTITTSNNNITNTDNNTNNSNDDNDIEQASLLGTTGGGGLLQQQQQVVQVQVQVKHPWDINDMSLKEKLNIVTGSSLWTTSEIKRLNIPSLNLADGPHGIRKPVKELSLQESYPATCFPTASAMACSWDESLLELVGEALHVECIYYNIHILLGPGLNLKRHPTGGRNFEYYSEDPILSGRLAAAYVNGIQKDGQTAACIKHLAINNQESHRFVVDAIVDERTAYELYYKGFEIAIKYSKPASIMCAYNKINGIYCSENKNLLTNIVRNKWSKKYYNNNNNNNNIDFIHITDWGATNNRIESIKAGMDLEMPGSHNVHYWEIYNALNDGKITMNDIDTCVTRMLNFIYKYSNNTNNNNNNTITPVYNKNDTMWIEHYNLAYKVAIESCVLLKNDNNFLPLDKNKIKRVALIGEFAKDSPRYQGMGSSQVNSEKVTTIYDQLLKYVDDQNIFYSPGYHADYDHVEIIVQQLVQQSIETITKQNNNVDVVIICVGLPEIIESEGFDRDHIHMPAQHNELINTICNMHPNVIVVLCNGGIVEIPWYDKPQAILEGFLLGEAGGAAIVDLLYGISSPCGKLSETIPIHMNDILSNKYFPGTRNRVEHREGLQVGYRHFDINNKNVRYPFGYGLSYTKFQYTNLIINKIKDIHNEVIIEVTMDIENIGNMIGKEIIQLYIHDYVTTIFKPEQELKDFLKIQLQPKQKENIKFILSYDTFTYYDIGIHNYQIENGIYEIRIGSNSRDIRLRGNITIEYAGIDQASQLAQLSYPPIKKSNKSNNNEDGNNNEDDEVDDITFAMRFGDDQKDQILQDIVNAKKKEEEDNNNNNILFDRNTLLKEVAKTSYIGKVLLSVVYKEAVKEVKIGKRSYRRQKKLVRKNVENLPLRTLVLFSRGHISFDTLDGCIALMNIRPLLAMKCFLYAFYDFIRRKK